MNPALTTAREFDENFSDVAAYQSERLTASGLTWRGVGAAR